MAVADGSRVAAAGHSADAEQFQLCLRAALEEHDTELSLATACALAFNKGFMQLSLADVDRVTKLVALELLCVCAQLSSSFRTPPVTTHAPILSGNKRLTSPRQ